MKLLSLTSLAIALSHTSPLNLTAQEYNFVRPTGGLTIRATAFGQYGPDLNVGVTTLTETVQVVSGQNLVRRFGSVYIPAFSLPEVTFHTVQSIPAQFPNPPTSAAGDLTFSISAEAATLPFDTGYVPMNWNGSEFALSAFVNFSLPIHQAVSLTTGGNTFGGTANSSINLALSLGSPIGTGNYPASIDLWNGNYFHETTPIYQFTAPNQFQAIAQIATVPEPNSFALIACALLAARTSKGRFIRKIHQ